jgi:outer membrane protein assembly factor BamB
VKPVPVNIPEQGKLLDLAAARIDEVSVPRAINSKAGSRERFGSSRSTPPWVSLGTMFFESLLVSTLAAAADWPQFLGPERDGSTSESGLIESWKQSGRLRERFRVAVGEGFSSVVASGGRVYSMDTDGSSEYVFALSADDGSLSWRHPLGRSPRDNYGGHGPRTTPTLDADRLFVLSAEGKLLSLEAPTGHMAWSRDLAKDYGFRPPAEGAASSPLVHGTQVIVMVGGRSGPTVGAFDRSTGKTLWTALEDRASYSSPVLLPLAGRNQLLVLTAHRLVSLAPGEGALLWSHPWETYDGVNVATPILAGANRVFISSGYDQGAALVEAKGESALPVWRNREMKNHFNNSVHHRGALYGFDMAILKAVDAATGETLWRARGFGTGSLIVAGDHLVVLSDAGEIALVEPDRADLKVVRRQQVMAGQTWTPPAVASGRIYLRNHEAIVALEP